MSISMDKTLKGINTLISGMKKSKKMYFYNDILSIFRKYYFWDWISFFQIFITIILSKYFFYNIYFIILLIILIILIIIIIKIIIFK